MSPEVLSFIGAFVVVLVLWGVTYLLLGTRDLRLYILGEDGRLSTSKTQWFLWTVVLLFSYTAIYLARVQQGHFEAVGPVPQNVLVALGLSTATMAVAKGIAVNKRQPKLADDQAASGMRWGMLVQENDGSPDLSKAQLLAWTFVALGVYLITVANQVHQISTQASIAVGMPDIDGALMALMGLGQGGYLAKKIVS